jgi:hypothetical protein
MTAREFTVRIVVPAVLGFVASFGCDKNESNPQAPAQRSEATTPATKPATAPLIPQVQLVDWCPEHGVPESVCTRCNKDLIPAFKEKGDWCEKHQLPDSQCITDHPELKAKFEAMAPKKG